MSRARTVFALMLIGAHCLLSIAQAQDYYSLVYDPVSGNLAVDFPESLPLLTTLELTSTAELFTGTRPEGLLTGLFDVFHPMKLFKLEPVGFGPTDFGPAVATGIEFDELASRLCARGSRKSGGGLGGAR